MNLVDQQRLATSTDAQTNPEKSADAGERVSPSAWARYKVFFFGLVGLVSIVGLGFTGLRISRFLPLHPLVGGGVASKVTPLPPVKPTPTPLPLFVPVTPVPQSTPTLPGGAMVALLELDSHLYNQPQGVFQFYPPSGWVLTQDNSSATFTAPDGLSHITVQITNTGETLDAVSFQRFVEASEENDAIQESNNPTYEVVDQKIDERQGRATVTKNLVVDGTSLTVMTAYRQEGQAIVTLDYWARRDVFQAYADQFEALLSGMTIDSASVARLDKYPQTYILNGPRNLFTLQVPVPWVHQSLSNSYKDGTYTAVDTFTAPDEHAVVYSIVYTDGNPMQASVAGDFALALLNKYFTKDVVVTKDQFMADGSERLTWYSPTGKYQGISEFQTHGSTFYLVGWMLQNDAENIYLDVVNRAVDSFKLP